MKSYYVYILASKARGTLYVGVTNCLERRQFEHIMDATEAFTQKYNVRRLVYCERTESIEVAIKREKQLKNWHRQWKINLIEAVNPTWKDLSLTYRMGPEINSG